MRGFDFLKTYLGEGTKNYGADFFHNYTFGLVDKFASLGTLAKRPLRTLKQEALLDGQLISWGGQRYLRQAAKRTTDFSARLSPENIASHVINSGTRHVTFKNGDRLQVKPLNDGSLRIRMSSAESKNRAFKIPTVQLIATETPKGLKTQKVQMLSRAGRLYHTQVMGSGITDEGLKKLSNQLAVLPEQIQ